MKTLPNDCFFARVEAEIAEGRPVRFRMKGCSMFPLLREGRDEVVLYPCKKEELRPMDVVLFRFKGKHILHRIIRRESNHLLLRGDGSYMARETCSVEDVVGKVREIVKPSGRTLATDSYQWRIPGYLWVHSGRLRVFMLKVLTHLKK